MQWPLPAVAGLAGAALGALGLGATRYQAPRCALMVFASSHLEEDWPQHVRAFYALSVKLVSGFMQISQSNPARHARAMALLDQAEAAGLRRQGWGYHYCRTDADAQAEGIAAAQSADQAALDLYYWNAEHQWGGAHQPGHERYDPGADNPVRTSRIFAETFHAATRRRRKLAWMSFTSESAAWFNSRHAVLDTPENVRPFDVWSPMIFASSPKIIAEKWATRVGKWRREFPGIIETPLVGTGRLLDPSAYSHWDPGGSAAGNAMGYAFDMGDSPGLLSLVHQSRPEGLTFFYGSGSRGMLSVGNTLNPPLSELAPALKAPGPGAWV